MCVYVFIVSVYVYVRTCVYTCMCVYIRMCNNHITKRPHDNCHNYAYLSDSSSATLMSCLMGLQKAVYYGVLGPVPVTPYHPLYIYYKRHHNSVLQQEIFK